MLDVIIFACTILGGIASLITIVEIVVKLCVRIYKYFHNKNARPGD